jgi:protein TonB
MSYAQRNELSGNRTLAIIIVVLLQFALGYAIVTGLAYNVIKKTVQDLKTFDVEEQPPPPEKPPPPPKDMPKVPPPPTMPPSIVQMRSPPPPIQMQVSPSPPVIPQVSVAPPAPPAPPPPPKPRQSQAKSLSGSLQNLFSGDDYPPSALDNNEQGTVSVSLTVGPNGRVASCSPSGGTASLRTATCRLITSRARFSPAQDANGNPTSSPYSQTITWRISE